jgi:hypothetical protein
MHWDQILTVFAVIATNLGTVLALYFNLDKKLEEHRRETNEILKGIQAEMKDFHTKLALQDQEFKMRLCAIEERNKK